MKLEIEIHAHPFYSDWNRDSPFHQMVPFLGTNVPYIRGYKWKVKVDDQMRITTEVQPMQTQDLEGLH